MYSINQLGFISELCQHSEVGKHLPSALYVHVSALPSLDPRLQIYEESAKFARAQQNINVVKFSTDKLKISYLFYPDFDTHPHPALQASIVVNLQTLETSYRDYRTSDNPPILHRKETFVTPDYPLYEQFAALTHHEQALGLLSNATAIGTRVLWEQRLELLGVELQGHNLIVHPERATGNSPRIERHKAAIARNELSRPVRLAVEADLFSLETTFFDYGCGYGGDISCIDKLGYSSTGWDPYYSPDTPRIAADIVNLGYVINVIEDTRERREALIKAWELTRQVLIVSAQVLISDRTRGQIAYGDGVVTRRNTFQKYYEQEELKSYIEQVLELEAIPVALGIYFVFRSPSQAQTFRASRYRSRATTPKIRVPSKRFEDYQELLAPLMNFISDRGRLPIKGEIEQELELLTEFASFKRAFQVILQATDANEWEVISQKRREDMLVYFALSKFSHRPKLVDLKPQVQEDIKALFGSYKQALLSADEMLFSIGNLDIIAQCCQTSEIGQKLPNSLTIHVSSLEALNPLLRLYEGCASRTIGRLDSANVIKFHTKKPKISYYFYPNFDNEPHPTLSASMQIDLRDLQAIYTDYDGDFDPPVLHQKDTLVTCDYPHYTKFAKLSDREQDWGLLDNWQAIKRLQGWQKCLIEHCATIQNHQLRWRKDADPYKLKLLRSALNKKRANSRTFFNT